jgi:hypothetical protein
MPDKDKKPHNDKHERHGHWEDYWSNNVPFCIGHYLNDIRYGYFIWRNKKNFIEDEEYYAR